MLSNERNPQCGTAGGLRASEGQFFICECIKSTFSESGTILIIWWYYDHAAFLKICSLYNHIFKMLNFLSFLALVLKEGVFALTTSSYASLLGVEQNFSLHSNLTIFKLISTLFFFFFSPSIITLGI